MNDVDEVSIWCEGIQNLRTQANEIYFKESGTNGIGAERKGKACKSVRPTCEKHFKFIESCVSLPRPARCQCSSGRMQWF